VSGDDSVDRSAGGHLNSDDLMGDRALEAADPDALDHLPLAERGAELVATSATPLNVALFGADAQAASRRRTPSSFPAIASRTIVAIDTPRSAANRRSLALRTAGPHITS